MKHRSRSRAQTEQERWLRRKNFCSLHSHTHTLLLLVLLLSALSHSYSYLECSCTPTSTSLWPPYHGTAEHTHTGTEHTYIRYIYFFISFVGLAFFDCDDFISFVFQFHFVSDNSAHSLAPSRLCWLFSPLSDSLAHTHTSHTDRAGGLQPINMSERQRRIYIFALYVRRYGCVCESVWLSVCCPVARAHSLQWLTWLI